MVRDCEDKEWTMDELLKLLEQNALESPANLAKMLGTTEAAVTEQIADYEKQGIIRGYQALINEDLLGLSRVEAVIEVKITPERQGGFDRIAERIGKFSEVRSMFLMSGTYDLLLFLRGETLHEAASFVSEKLATMDGVVSTATHFKLKTYKHQGVLMQQGEQDERLKVSP